MFAGMSTEQLLIYAAVALGGWLLRHYGIGAGSTVFGAGKSGPVSSPAVAPAVHSATATSLKAEAESAVKAAVESAVAAAVNDMKQQLGVKP